MIVTRLTARGTYAILFGRSGSEIPLGKVQSAFPKPRRRTKLSHEGSIDHRL